MHVQFIGLDLGQTSDPTALVLLERPVWCGDAHISPAEVPLLAYTDPARRSAELHLRALKRYPLQTSYPAIVADVARLMGTLRHRDSTALVIDWTGVGRPVFDMFVAAGLDPIGIAIHGGDTVIDVPGGHRVPKRDLVGAVQSLLSRRLLKFAADLPLLDVLKGELQNFRVKIDPKTAHDAYSAWRENQHDDTVLATAVAAWYAERTDHSRAGVMQFAPPARMARR